MGRCPGVRAEVVVVIVLLAAPATLYAQVPAFNCQGGALASDEKERVRALLVGWAR